MRSWRRLLGAALTDPRRAAIIIGAVALLVAATVAAALVALRPGSAPRPAIPPAVAATPGAGAAPGSSVASSAPPGDRPVLARLAGFAGKLAAGPTPGLRPAGIGSRYTPDPSGASIRGEFFQMGASGTCYVVTFSADRSWLVVGDPGGVSVSGPAAAPAARCASDAAPDPTPAR